MALVERKLEGIIIPAITPFDKDGKIDFDAMEYNYRQWNKTHISGYMCLGSNGEFRSLTDEESLVVIRKAARLRASDKLLIAGVGRDSLVHTLEIVRILNEEKLDIDYISVITPCYFASLMTDEALVAYFNAVADFSDYPVLLYCAPTFVNNVCLSVKAVQKLAEHPNIYGIKDTSKMMMGNYMEVIGVRDDFSILAGSLGNLRECLDKGGKGGVVSAANYFPEECAQIIELFHKEGKDAAFKYLEYMKQLARATGGAASVAGVKCAMNLVGLKGGVPRLPVRPVGKELVNRMDIEIKRHRLQSIHKVNSL